MCAAARRAQRGGDPGEVGRGGGRAVSLGDPFRGVAGRLDSRVEPQRPGQTQPEPGPDRGEPLVVRSGQVGGGGQERDGRFVRSGGLGQVRGLERGGNPGGRTRQGLAAGVLGGDLGGLGAGGDPLPSRLQGLRQTPVQPGLPGGAESVVDRLPGQGVHELVPFGGPGGPDQSGGQQLIEGGQCGLGGARSCGPRAAASSPCPHRPTAGRPGSAAPARGPTPP